MTGKTCLAITLFLSLSMPALPAHAENTTELMNQAIQMSIKGDRENARKIFLGILEKNPNDIFALNNLGKLYADAGEFDQALEVSWKAVRLNPGFSMAQNNLADIYRQKGDLEQAEKIYREALSRFPDFELPNAGLGELCLEQKRYDEALVYLQKAASIAPWVPRFHQLLGKSYTGKNMTAEAEKEFELYNQLSKH